MTTFHGKRTYFIVFFSLLIFTFFSLFWRTVFVKTIVLQRYVQYVNHPIVIHTETFQKVNNKSAMYVFSAYHDDREQNQVRVIGAWKERNVRRVYCKFWYRAANIDNRFLVWVVRGNVESVDGKSETNSFVGAYFHCPLPDGDIPHAVSVTTNLTEEPLNRVLVSSRKLPYQERRNFTVCVAPLHNKYDYTYRFVEWLEMNSILGAEKFVFYNLNASENINHLLKYYVSIGLAEVVSWNLPDEVYADINYCGQIIQLQDCLYRQKYLTKYIVNEDLDEFIIPRQQGVMTWSDMLSKLPVVSEYIFQNSFFRMDRSETPENIPGNSLVRRYNLVTLLKTHREKWLIPVYPNKLDKLLGIGLYDRTKYIINPTRVTTLNVHYVADMENTESVSIVPPTLGLSHHYRMLDEYSATIEDETTLKYKDKLTEKVHSRWTDISLFIGNSTVTQL